MYNFGNVGLNDPSSVLSLSMEVGDEYFSGNPSSDLNWDKKAAKFLNYGVPKNPLDIRSTEFDSNQPIEHTYSVYPWKDNTHNQIQPYQLVFVSKYLDPEYQLVNMAPIYRLNIAMNEQYNKCYRNFGFNKTENKQFIDALNEYGETALTNYKSYPYNDIESEPLSTFYNQAVSENYMFLTKQGILSKWNFIGAVISKQQSTAPNDNLDFPQHTESINVVGVVIGQEARVYNIWGNVKPGDKLFLVLTKKKTADGTFGAFQWKPYFCKRDYPNFDYEDDAGMKQRAYVQYVGLCTRNMEGEPSEIQKERAIGSYNILSEAYESYGSLPCITVQIGI